MEVTLINYYKSVQTHSKTRTICYRKKVIGFGSGEGKKLEIIKWKLELKQGQFAAAIQWPVLSLFSILINWLCEGEEMLGIKWSELRI